MRFFTDEFDDIVAQLPDHTAILTNGSDRLSYAALAQCARMIAAAIPAGAAGRCVAIHITKSADYIAAVLGCWYAGAAFMPLDPDLPSARRAHMLADAAPVALLTVTACKDHGGVDVVDITQEITAAPVTVCALTPDTAAYIIYTSGSTGQPKGVVVTHRALVDVLQAQIELFGLNAESRSLFYLSTSFDASISDFGTALLAGATLCIETIGKLETAAQLPALIAERGITYADLPPALLQLLDPASIPPCLKTICIGGEVCPPAVVRRWAADRRIVCVYGPTEATICTSASVCDKATWQQPLIGVPLPGIRYLICDRDLKPCDDGELLIAGRALAEGYLNQPALTAQKFIMLDGIRWYRTGDHVRREDGGIVFVGRIDRQFKWRGQLVEPEEVERALRQYAGISRAAVLRQALDGHEQLVAHIECRDTLDAEQLRGALGILLPAWMIPTTFIEHSRMPLTASGKIDMAALGISAGRIRKFTDNSTFVAATDAQVKLLLCWQSVLGRVDIPADVPFAALGGDSFNALRLILLADEAGIALGSDFIARHPTLNAQARNLHTLRDQDDVMTGDQLRDDIARHFPLPVVSNADRASVPVRDVLFTGATGFLGRRLLQVLLARTDWTFHLIVRDNDSAAAWQRLGFDDNHRDRLRLVQGDVAQENLGLDAQTWNILADRIDAIIHCAAVVNMTSTYNALKDANVRSVHSLLLLASTGKAKIIHHASTLSVFVATDRNTGIAREDDLLEAPQNVYGGYAQSKWAAEALITNSTAPAATYRLGLITGDSTTAACSKHDFLRTFMKGLTSLGHVPAGAHEGLMVDVTPVDYAADMMAAGIINNATGVMHIANRYGFSLEQIIKALIRAGHTITPLTPQHWRSWIERRNATHAPSAEESASIMALCRLMDQETFARQRTMDIFQATGISFDTTRMQNHAGKLWREPPVADDRLLDLYVREFDLRPIPAKKSLAI